MIKFELNNKSTVTELAQEIGVDVATVAKAIQNNQIVLFENLADLKTFIKTKSESVNIDLYQLLNGLYAVDLSLLSRGGK